MMKDYVKTPMSREEITAYFKLSAVLAEDIKALPYRDAANALDRLKEMADIVGEQLPGGYIGECLHCDEAKGEDEMVDCGDEKLCSDCVDAWDKSEARAAIAAAGEG
jgi:hypothetical protein